jgi:hypothetical protein
MAMCQGRLQRFTVLRFRPRTVTGHGLNLVRYFDEILVRVVEVHRTQHALRTGPAHGTQDDLNTTVLKVLHHPVQGRVRQQAEVSRARGRMPHIRVEHAPDLVQVDLLLTEVQCNTSLTERANIHAKHAYIELGGSLDVRDRQDKVIEAPDQDRCHLLPLTRGDGINEAPSGNSGEPISASAARATEPNRKLTRRGHPTGRVPNISMATRRALPREAETMGDFFHDLGWKLLVAFAAGLLTSGWRVVGDWVLGVLDMLQSRRALAPRYKGSIDFGSGKSEEIVFEPRKRGHRISGKIIFINADYPVTGRYADGYLTLSYAAKDATNTSQGTATFRVLDDHLEGVIAYRRADSLAIESAQGKLLATL